MTKFRNTRKGFNKADPGPLDANGQPVGAWDDSTCMPTHNRQSGRQNTVSHRR